MPDSDAEREHAIRSAATDAEDRWEWIANGGRKVVALYLAGFRTEDGARSYGARNRLTAPHDDTQQNGDVDE